MPINCTTSIRCTKRMFNRNRARLYKLYNVSFLLISLSNLCPLNELRRHRCDIGSLGCRSPRRQPLSGAWNLSKRPLTHCNLYYKTDMHHSATLWTPKDTRSCVLQIYVILKVSKTPVRQNWVICPHNYKRIWSTCDAGIISAYRPCWCKKSIHRLIFNTERLAKLWVCSLQYYLAILR